MMIPGNDGSDYNDLSLFLEALKGDNALTYVRRCTCA